MRVYLGNREIAGYYTNLKKGLEQCGVTCDVVSFMEHPFEYGGEAAPCVPVRLLQWIGRGYLNAPGSGIRRYLCLALWLLMRELLRPFIFIWAAQRYDVFIFRSTSNLLWFFDLPLLKLMKKRVIYVFHGSDSRPLYMNGVFMLKATLLRIPVFVAVTWIQKFLIDIINRYADVVLCGPSMGQFNTQPFVSCFAVGMPYEHQSREHEADAGRTNPNALRVLHSPSRPVAKGTYEIRTVIDRLKQRGYEIDFIEITGQPNEIVLRELAQCDFVIDSLYCDTPINGFATEAAFAGKPTVIGGYYADYIVDDIPESLRPPTVYCHPDKFEAEVERLISDAAWRLDRGRVIEEYVCENWTAEKVAGRYLQLIRDEIPVDWYFDPQNIKSFHGFGLSKTNLKKFLRQFLRIGGRRSLRLEDKPQLRDRIVEFVRD